MAWVMNKNGDLVYRRLNEGDGHPDGDGPAGQDGRILRKACVQVLRYRGDRRKRVEISREMALYLADFLEAHDA